MSKKLYPSTTKYCFDGQHKVVNEEDELRVEHIELSTPDEEIGGMSFYACTKSRRIAELEAALRDLHGCVKAAIKAGDWFVDGACDPYAAMRRAEKLLSLEQD